MCIIRVPCSDDSAMKIELSYEERDVILEALEHAYAYTRAAKRETICIPRASGPTQGFGRCE
jgi:hypothetical protein